MHRFQKNGYPFFKGVTVIGRKSHPAACALAIGLALGGSMAAVMLAAVYLFILRGW